MFEGSAPWVFSHKFFDFCAAILNSAEAAELLRLRRQVEWLCVLTDA